MAKLNIIIGSPENTPEDPRTDFQKVQEEIDRARWVGRGPHYVLGGGGNDIEEHEPEVNPEHEWR